jgi:threonine/homoserine/homoserine lactone efflux protein
MTTYGLLAFSAMAVFLILVPSPLFRLTARFVLQRGRSAALATIPGLAVGLSIAAGLATIPLLLLSRFAPDTIGLVAFVGPWYLLAYVVFCYLDPRRRRPMADNDNLPERRTVRIFAHVAKEAVLSPRYTLAFVAVLIQVWDATIPPLTQVLAVELACATIMIGAAAVQSLLPGRFLNRKRPAARGKSATRKAQTVFIARRAVTAGYRRIAA